MSKVSSECDQKRVEHIMLKAQVGVRGVGTLPVFSVMRSYRSHMSDTG